MATPASPSADLAELVGRLAAHRTVGAAPRAELEWLVRHGHLEQRRAGASVASAADPIAGMYILFSGRLSLYQVRGAVRHKIAE